MNNTSKYLNPWTCPECSKINDDKNNECVNCKCFQSKSKEYQKQKGDWKCYNVECNEINFGSRTKCRKCFSVNSPFYDCKFDCKMTIENNKGEIILSSYTDFKDNNEYLRGISKYEELEGKLTILKNKYPDFIIIIDNFMIHRHQKKDLLYATHLKEALGDKVIFKRCSLVDEYTGAYFGKKPQFIKDFTG